MPGAPLDASHRSLALVGVTAIWGYTFVPVQEAVAIYPLFAFLAVRFAISTLVLAPFAWRPLRTLPRAGVVARASAPAPSSPPPTACRRPGST